MFEKLMFWKKDDLDFKAPDKSLFGEEPAIPELGPRDDLGLPKTPEPGYGAEITPPGEIPPPGMQIHNQQATADPYASIPPPSPPAQFQASQPAQTASHEQHVTMEILSRDIAILSSKMDTLRVQLDNISHRLNNIERIALDEEKKAKSW